MNEETKDTMEQKDKAEPACEEPAAKDTEKAEKAEKEEKKSRREQKAEKAEAAALKETCAKLEEQLAEEKDRYLRMMAEYENFRRRSQKEHDAAYTDAYADVLSQIVPVIDNLERAVSYGASEKLLDGVNMTLTQFCETLSKMGVEAFGEEGENFDPQMHNAIMHEEDESQPENTITAVFQKGYRKGDRVIRFAMVKVVN